MNHIFNKQALRNMFTGAVLSVNAQNRSASGTVQDAEADRTAKVKPLAIGASKPFAPFTR